MAVIKVFSASWCKSCPTYKKALISRGVEFEDISLDDDHPNIKENMALATKLGVRSLPTTIVVDSNDDVVRMVVGNSYIDEIVDAYNDK